MLSFFRVVVVIPGNVREVLVDGFGEPDHRARVAMPGRKSFDGGEGLWYHQGVVYVSTKGDNRVWAYDAVNQRIDLVYDDSLVPAGAAPLTGVDNITGGAGVKVVYDSVGKDTFERSLDCLRPFGLMVCFGNASGPVPPLDVLRLSTKGSLLSQRDGGVTIKDMGVLAAGNLMGGAAPIGQMLQKQIGQTGIPVYNVANACATGATALRTAIIGSAGFAGVPGGAIRRGSRSPWCSGPAVSSISSTCPVMPGSWSRRWWKAQAGRAVAARPAPAPYSSSSSGTPRKWPRSSRLGRHVRSKTPGTSCAKSRHSPR